MKKERITVMVVVISLILLNGCGIGVRNPFKEPPLKEEMSFSYQETAEYKGRTMQKRIDIAFKKRDDGMFDCIKTYTDRNGSGEQEPLKVDGFFKYNKIMDSLVSSYRLWRDPKVLASGSIGRMKVEEGTYNGKQVYVCIQDEKDREYYDMQTGLLEGGYTDTGNTKQTVVRLR